MGEYIPTERELIDELCSARGCDWESMAKDLKSIYDVIHRCPLSKLIEFLTIPPIRNYEAIPLDAMSSPNEWREMELMDILKEIECSDEAHRKRVRDMVRRYRTAAMKLLTGTPCWPLFYSESLDCSVRAKWERLRDLKVSDKLSMIDVPESDLTTSFPFAGKEFTTKGLVQKTIVLQELQRQLSDVTQKTTTPAGDQEPTALWLPDHEVKKDGRVIVADQKAYSREMFPQMIELISKGATKTNASEIVAAPFGIKGNTVEKKFNTFMKNKKNAINLLSEIGRDDLIEKLDGLNV